MKYIRVSDIKYVCDAWHDHDVEQIEITNCEHCMEWHPREATDYGFCIRWGQYTKVSDYCSYGK